MARRSAFARLLVTGLLAACGGGSDGGGSTTPTVSPPVLTTLTVSLGQSTVALGASTSAAASGTDQRGAPIATGAITWTSSAPAVATISGTGGISALSVGQTTITATAAGKSGQATLTITPPPVNSVVISPTAITIAYGGTQQLTAATLDAQGNLLTGRPVTWGASDPSRITVTAGGLVTAIGGGTASVTATSEGRTATVPVTVNGVAPVCAGVAPVSLALGEVRQLTAAQIARLCVGGLPAASEYTLIPFNNSAVASVTVPATVTAAYTLPVTTALLSPAAERVPLLDRSVRVLSSSRARAANDWEWRMREREANEIRGLPPAPANRAALVSLGTLATPAIGSVVQMRYGTSCTTFTSRPTRVVGLTPHTVVLVDETAPTGGYSDAEMVQLAQVFDTSGYVVAVENFGAPADLDGNGRVGIVFTPEVNRQAAEPGTYIAGFAAAKDHLLAGACGGSNEGELFYMAVPDVNGSINRNYDDKAFLQAGVVVTLTHEMQHLISASRGLNITKVGCCEEVWLNEGLSHVAEELLYYRASGLTPRSNLSAATALSTPQRTALFDVYAFDNLFNVAEYWKAPSSNAPFAPNDLLATRGAIWQFLRYLVDRRGGTERDLWFALVNSRFAGRSNIINVFGTFTGFLRDWTVAQVLDDAGIPASASYLHPSWNFRDVSAALFSGFPLATVGLAGTPVNLQVVAGGAGYLRFQLGSNVVAAIGTTSSGQTAPAQLDMMLVRTK